MSSLVVVGFPTAAEAEQVRRELVDIQRERLIALEDAVVVERDGKGGVHLRQAINLTATGAVGGVFWGALVGLLFLNPLLGAAVGGGVGRSRASRMCLGGARRLHSDAGRSSRPHCASRCSGATGVRRCVAGM
jgi:uncharacterized membrane protein